jgi:hypothetical protein
MLGASSVLVLVLVIRAPQAFGVGNRGFGGPPWASRRSGPSPCNDRDWSQA